jgi:hypothetical protein
MAETRHVPLCGCSTQSVHTHTHIVIDNSKESFLSHRNTAELDYKEQNLAENSHLGVIAPLWLALLKFKHHKLQGKKNCNVLVMPLHIVY